MARGQVTSWIGEAACGAVLTVTGLAFAWGASRMQMVDDGVPGPGMAPFFLGVMLAGLGVMIGGAAMIRRARDVVVVLERETLLAIFLLSTAVITFDRIGYVTSTFLFLWSSFVLIGREPPLPAALFAATATMLTWALFVKALGVALPVGILALP